MRTPLLCLTLGLLAALFALGCGPAGMDGPPGAGVTTRTAHPRVIRYVRGDVARHLVVEVDWVEGAEPFEGSGPRLAERLLGLLDKPDGIQVVADRTIDSRGSDHGWTFEELRALSLATFDLAVPADGISMHVMFLNGHYAESPGGTVLGMAWENAHVAIFKRAIEQACGAMGLPPFLATRLCEEGELAVWLHEVGHVIGLVDIGLVMTEDHEDPEHPGHDRNRDCVMYWAYEGDALLQRLADELLATGNAALDFDAACRADVAALRDGE